MTDREIFMNAPGDDDPEELAAYLDKMCGEDAELRARVEALIAADAEAGTGFMGEEQRRDPGTGFEGTSSDAWSVPEGEGDVIGNYKLLQKIGEGGFGVVYMADQLKPVKRRVALKIIKLGMDTRQVVARFEVERQALAMMDHPHIAKVLDAGSTETGRPFFVMELVRGIPITTFCDERNLSTEERLVLFMDVCRAVQHAHQKGIIHRDLKPSNVMVTLHDDKAVVKVIDFGIAKATQMELTDKTLFTRYEQFIGTPAYMSPEQAQLSGWDIDTRSDIYSLGVLLYALLTGRTPFDAKELMKAGYDEIRRIIREDEPPKPSTRLGTLEGPELTELAKHHRSDPQKLRLLMRGDLDWIVMKALEKDRTRRYETANALAMDLRRHLENEPVSAAAPNAAYRIGKYVKRHRGPVITGTTMLILLVAGFTTTTWQWIDARESRKEEARLRLEAERQRVRAEEGFASARQNLYSSDMLLAQDALDDSNRGRARELLERHRYMEGHEDLRGWEWDYLWQQVQGDALYPLGKQPDGIKSIRVASDGRRALTFDRAGIVTLWDLALRKRIASFQAGERCFDGVVSPDGRFAAAAVADNDDGGQLKVWDLHSESLLHDVELECFSNALAYSPDGAQLAVMIAPLGLVQIRKADTLAVVHRISIAQWRGNAMDPGAMEYSPDGSRLVVGQRNGSIVLVDPEEGKVLSEHQVFDSDLGAYREAIVALAISPKGDLVAASAGYSNAPVKVVDMRTGKIVIELGEEGHAAWVSSLRFSPEGSTLVTASADQTLRVWNVADWKLQKTLHGHAIEVWAVDFSPDGQKLVSGSKEGELLIWDVQAQRAIQEYVLEDSVEFGFLPNTRKVVSLTKSGSLTFADLNPEGVVHYESTLRVLDPDGSLGLTMESRLGVSPSGRFLAVTTEGGEIAVVEWPGDPKKMKITASMRGGTVLRFTDNESMLATADWTRDVLEVWSTDKWELLHQVPFDESIRVTAAGISGDGRSYVIGGRWGKMRVGSVAKPEEGFIVEAHRGMISECAFSPDSRWVASGASDGKISIWNATTGTSEKRLWGHLLAVTAVTYSPHGNRLVTGSTEGSLRLWDVGSGQQLLHLVSGEYQVNRVRFSGDGAMLGALGKDGCLRVWRAESSHGSVIDSSINHE